MVQKVWRGGGWAVGSAFLKWCNYAFCSRQEWAGGVLQAGMVLLGDTAGLLPYMGKHLNWLRRLEFRGVTSQPATSPRIWIKKFHFFFFFFLAGIWTSGIFPRKQGKPRRFTFCSLGSGVRDRFVLNMWRGRGGVGKKKPRLRVDRPVLVRFCSHVGRILRELGWDSQWGRGLARYRC